MDEAILHLLQLTKDPSEKAALVAEFVLDSLPEHLALLARRCIVLHWFDLSLAKALLQDTSHTEDEIHKLYSQLLTLNFIEKLPWGAAFQDLTREGLLKQYARVQPEFLKNSATLAAPIYASRGSDDKLVAEALFCYMIEGNQEATIALLEDLLRHASHHEDWQYISTLFSLLDEAKRLSFVSPVLLSEEQQFLRELVNGVQEIQKIFPMDAYASVQAKKAWINICKGTRYASKGNLKKAQANYDDALHLYPRLTIIHAAKGIVAMKQNDYSQALQNFTTALESNADNIFLLQKQGIALNDNNYFTEALAVYEHILHLDSNISAAYREKGKVLTELERYEDALTVFEQSILIEANDAEAYAGKSVVLSRLKRYPEAQIAREIAERLAPKDSYKDEETKYGLTSNKLPSQKMNAKMFSRSRRQPTQNIQPLFKSFTNKSLAFLVVMVLIVASAILFPVIHSTTTGSRNLNATATAQQHSLNTTATARNTTITPKPISRLELQYHRLTLSIDSSGIINNSQTAINGVKQRLLSQSFLQGREVGLAIIYDGAPSDADINRAEAISGKMYDILHQLGQEGFAFSRASYYDPLYILGASPNNVTIDVYLFS